MLELLVLPVDGPGDRTFFKRSQHAQADVFAVPARDQAVHESRNVHRFRPGKLDGDGQFPALRAPADGRLDPPPKERLDVREKACGIDVVDLKRLPVEDQHVFEGIGPPKPAIAAGDRPNLSNPGILSQASFEIARDVLEFLQVVAVKLDVRIVKGSSPNARIKALGIEAGDADVDSGELGRDLNEFLLQLIGAVGHFDLRGEGDDKISPLGADLGVDVLFVRLLEALGFEGPDDLVRRLDACPRRHAEADSQLVAGIPSEKFAQRHFLSEPGVASIEKGGDDENDRNGMADQERDQSSGRLPEPALPMVPPHGQQFGTQSGNQREGDEHGDGQRRGDDDGQGKIIDFQPALEKREGKKNAHRGQRRGQDGDEHLAGPLDCSLGRGQAALPEPQDAFEDDDRIVDEKTQPEGQPSERQHVDGHTETIDEIEGQENGKDDGGQDEKRRPDVFQNDPDEDEQHGENDQDEKAELADALQDLRALVVDGAEDQVGGQFPADLVQAFLDLARNAERAHAFFLVDGQPESGLSVDPIDAADFAVGRKHGGHVPEKNRHAARTADDHVFQGFPVAQKAGDFEQVFLFPPPDFPGREGLIPPVEGRLHMERLDPQGRHPVVVHLDPDFGVGTPTDFDGLDPPDGSQLVFEGFLEHGPEMLQGVVAGYRVLEKGPGAEIFGHIGNDLRPRRARRQLVTEAGDFFLEGQSGEFHVRLQVEFQSDQGIPDGRARGDLAHALDPHRNLFEEGCDLGLDDFGRNVGPECLDADPGIILARSQFQRDVHERIDAQEGRGQKQHDRRNRAFDAGFHRRLRSFQPSAIS